MRKIAHACLPALLAAAGVTLLASCALPPKGMPMSRVQCTTKPCKLVVKVSGCSQSQIRTHPKILDVPNKHDADIVWEIDGPSAWTFTDKGVEFKKGSGGGGFGPGAGGGSRTFRLHNNNSNKGEHHYNVNLTNDGGRTVCTEDPTIVNH